MPLVSAVYSVASPKSLPIRLAGYQRRRLYTSFIDQMKPNELDTFVDIGTTSDDTYAHSNYFVAWYPYKQRITACGLDDASFLVSRYPGLTFSRADGRDLPFAANSFDYAHSNAVLEHVGSRAQQMKFIAEMWRVARKGIYLSTPNRWFPVEFHTVLPIIHWLPHRGFSAALHLLGLDFFADIENLNLLSHQDLRTLARKAGIPSFKVGSISLGGWPANLHLHAKKPRITGHLAGTQRCERSESSDNPYTKKLIQLSIDSHQ